MAGSGIILRWGEGVTTPFDAVVIAAFLGMVVEDRVLVWPGRCDGLIRDRWLAGGRELNKRSNPFRF